MCLLLYRDRQEKKFNDSQQIPNTIRSGPPVTHAHYRPVSSTVVEGQDDYLQPNTNTHAQKPAAKADEPLIHIWETPLPDPTGNHPQQPGTCTVHRNQKGQTEPRVHPNTTEGQIQSNTSNTNPATTPKETIRTGTSYYSPNTGHKYYVLDK